MGSGDSSFFFAWMCDYFSNIYWKNAILFLTFVKDILTAYLNLLSFVMIIEPTFIISILLKI